MMLPVRPLPVRPSECARLALAAAAVLATALSSSCSSPGSSLSGSRDVEEAQRMEDELPAMRITLRDYAGGRRFELVNPSHTDPVSYYSRQRAEASRKVVAGTVVTQLLEYLEDNGLADHVQAGALPASGARATRGLEIEGPNGVAHWVVTDASTPDERKAMNECTRAFFDTYNVITSYQAIDNRDGSRYFNQSAAEARATGGGR